METSKQAPLLRELKNYLIHLKDLGYTDIPLEADLFADAQKGNVPLDSHPPQSLNKMVSKNNRGGIPNGIPKCSQPVKLSVVFDDNRK